MGSSGGISKVHNRLELAPSLNTAAGYDCKIIVEKALDAREIECAVLGNDEPEASVPGEVIPSRAFYDYEAKYMDAASQTVLPADLPEALTAHPADEFVASLTGGNLLYGVADGTRVTLDDGTVIEVAEAASPSRLAERAEAIGGHLEVTARPGQGTAVVVKVD